MLYGLDNVNRTSWVTYVKNILFRYGFGYAWIVQDVGDRNLFLSQFKQCVLDCDAQQWQTSVSNNTKLLCYSTYKSLLNVELYLKCIQSVVFKQALSRFRCSCHNLMIELGRRQGIDQEVRLCRYCTRFGFDYIEDEYHFLLVCYAFSDLVHVIMKILHYNALSIS